MSDENKNNSIISGLLAGAAIYFGLKNNADRLGDLAQTAVSRVISDQMPKNSSNQHNPNHNRRRGKKHKGQHSLK